LVDIVIKDFRAQFIAVAIAHAQVIINFNFHFCDLSYKKYGFDEQKIVLLIQT
jgi:hypothetical protein